MTEASILRIVFPPDGAIPLERIDHLPEIRAHIAAITSLASGARQPQKSGTRYIRRAEESRAATAKIIELWESKDPDGHQRTWNEIAAIVGMGLTGNACRNRYDNYKKTRAAGGQTGAPAENVHPSEDSTIRELQIVEKVDTVSLKEVSPDIPEEAKKGKEKPEEFGGEDRGLTPGERGHRLGPKIPHDLDDELIRLKDGGKTYNDIHKILLARGIKCTQSDISTRIITERKKREQTQQNGKPAELEHVALDPAGDGSRAQKDKSTPPTQEAAEGNPEAVSISRKELDLRIWDMWKAGKTLDEISDILYSEGLYYSAKSVRVKLLALGAKL